MRHQGRCGDDPQEDAGISPRSKTCREAGGYAGCEEARAQTFFTPAEALGLCEAISASMMYVGFGVPNAAEE